MFSDTELDVIMRLAMRADPFDMIAELGSIKQKIQAYAREQAQAQHVNGATPKKRRGAKAES